MQYVAANNLVCNKMLLILSLSSNFSSVLHFSWTYLWFEGTKWGRTQRHYEFVLKNSICNEKNDMCWMMVVIKREERSSHVHANVRTRHYITYCMIWRLDNIVRSSKYGVQSVTRRTSGSVEIFFFRSSISCTVIVGWVNRDYTPKKKNQQLNTAINTRTTI